MLNTDFASYLFGPSRHRRYRQTVADWRRTEGAWKRSPLACEDLDAIATRLIGEILGEARLELPSRVVDALHATTTTLLLWEDVGSLEVEWDTIKTDPVVGLRFRQMLTRRSGWTRNTRRYLGIFCDAFQRAIGDIIYDIQGSGINDQGSHVAIFEVPLIELIKDPPLLVEHIVTAPYMGAALDCNLFQRLRQRLEFNLLSANGLSPSSHIRGVARKLVLPRNQKNAPATVLIDQYLSGTPFRTLLELPVPLSIPDQVRFEHCHIVGGTGHGKTQLMQRMIHGDLVAAARERRSVVVIDSQGDLIAKLMRLGLFSPDVPGSLSDRLVVINPSDVEFPASLNLFDAHLDRLSAYRPVDQERVLNGVVELYETFFGDLLGAELTQKQGVIFKYLARLMLTIPGATIHTLMQLMEDGKPFRPYMAQLEGSARYFYEREFFDPSFAATKKQILKRLWGVLATPAFERMFAQDRNKLDLFQALQDGKIVLVNTAKDLLKREGSQLFGRFFIAMLAQAALERSTVPEQERTPTFVYVDEAQEYFDDTIETILNQARKYRVGLTLAHQTLDQLTPRLRSVLHANTSLKCAGGVSAKDARALADELHTESDFIESMHRRGSRTEFAVWLKNRTPHAVRLSVPLGHLERQQVLTEEAFDELIDRNRRRYCGTLADVKRMMPAVPVRPVAPPDAERPDVQEVDTGSTSSVEPIRVMPPALPGDSPPSATGPDGEGIPAPPARPIPAPRVRVPPNERELGKGGPKHRYLQALVKELGEQQGFRATIEAPLARGAGQVDVLLERGDVQVAFEVSVTTPVEQERENVLKCLAEGYARVALVLAKTRATEGRYRSAIIEALLPADRDRVTFLAPEEIPDYISALAEPPAPTESVVKGYRVKVSHTATTPEDARGRRSTVARIVAASLRDS